MLYKKSGLLILLLLFIIAACSPAGTEPDAASGNDGAVQVAAEAIPAARQALADFLGIAPDDLALEKVEDAEWSDGCLGLGGPAESCAAVITPGFAITFATAGESYVVRTDLDGTQARVEAAAPGAPAGDALPPAVEAARMALANQLGADSAAVSIIRFEQREWSDGCLGLGGPAELCATVITPGWEVILEANGQQVEARTDLNGEQVRIADERAGAPAGEIPGPDLNGAVLFFQRSGGFDGRLLTVRIYADGTIERALGQPALDMPIETTAVEPAAVETLLSKLRSADYFSLERTYLPEDTCCDRFLYLISVQAETEGHTVEALEAVDDTPDALWQSIDLIEAFVNDSFGG